MYYSDIENNAVARINHDGSSYQFLANTQHGSIGRLIYQSVSCDTSKLCHFLSFFHYSSLSIAIMLYLTQHARAN